MHGEQAAKGDGIQLRVRVFDPQRLNDHASTPDVTGPSPQDDFFEPASSCDGAHFGTCWHKTMARVAPQCDQQLSRDRHDRHAPVSLAMAVGALHEPSGDGAACLEAHPTPRELDEASSHDGVPCLADALLMLQATAAIRAGCQSGESRYAATVSEVATKDLTCQHHGSVAPHASQLFQLDELCLPAPVALRGILPGTPLPLPASVLLRFRNVPKHQLET